MDTSIPKEKLDQLLEGLSYMSGLKAGARNNADDQKRIQLMHDMTKDMGADCGENKAGKRWSDADMKLLQSIHDTAVNLGGDCPGDASTKAASDNPKDYLVVEDPEKSTTWHLQVRKNGKPDHTLMGAAWAALHGGYRGNKYSGPGKAEALKKLKKLYESEDMATPDEAKSVSLDKQTGHIRDEFYEEFSLQGGWVVEVFDDKVIARIGDDYYEIPYVVTASAEEGEFGDVEFASNDKWTKVESAWVPAKAAEMLASFGTEIKSLDNGHIGGYIVRFTDAKKPDSGGDFFDNTTDFGAPVKGMRGPVYFHHCLAFKSATGTKTYQIKEKVGEATLDEDEQGVLIDAMLYNHNKYYAALTKAVKSVDGKGRPLLGWSSGTAAHLVQRTRAGKSAHIDRWPLGLDFSLTMMPAEPSNFAVSVKSIEGIAVNWPEDALDASAGSNQQSHEQHKDDFVMDETTKKEMAALIADGIKAHEEAKAAEAEKKRKEEEEFNKRVDEEIKARIAKGRPVNAAATKTDTKDTGGPALNLLYPQGDDAFKAFNAYLRRGDNGGLRADSEAYKAAPDLVHWQDWQESIKAAVIQSGGVKAWEALKTTYPVVQETQYEGQELVPTLVYNKIQELRDPVSIARVGGAEVIPIGAKTMQFPVEKNRSGKFAIVADGTAYDANVVQLFDKATVTAYKFTRTIQMGETILEDSAADLSTWWTRHVARMEANTENYYFFLGNGTTQPGGVTVQGGSAFTSASGAAIANTEVVKLFYNLSQPYRNKVTMSCNNTTEAALRSLSANAWWQFQPTPLGTVGQDQGNYQMGADWIVSPTCKLMVAPDMASIGVNNIALVAGNWEEYVIGDRQAMSVFRDPYSQRVNGYICFHCSFRRGGALRISEAFKFITQASA